METHSPNREGKAASRQLSRNLKSKRYSDGKMIPHGLYDIGLHKLTSTWAPRVMAATHGRAVAPRILNAKRLVDSDSVGCCHDSPVTVPLSSLNTVHEDTYECAPDKDRNGTERELAR